MEARIKATGKIVDIIRNSAFDKDVFYDSNGQKYNREELSFDFKEKSFPKDEDYWTRLEHQYAGMAMQGLMSYVEQITPKEGRSFCDEIVDISFKVAHALVEKYKKEEK